MSYLIFDEGKSNKERYYDSIIPVLKEKDFEQEDEAQEEVREKNKSNKHIGRDDS